MYYKVSMSTEDAFNTALRISLERTQVFPSSQWTKYF